MSVNGLAVAGTPLMVLNELMTVPDAGLERRPERREIDGAQGPLREVHGVVIAAPLRRAVGDPVLGAGQDPIGGGRVVALEAADAGPGHDRLRGRDPRPIPPMIRPHRGSRAMSTMGAKVHFSPVAAASAAAIRADRSTAAGSQLLASPRGIGKIVR